MSLHMEAYLNIVAKNNTLSLSLSLSLSTIPTSHLFSLLRRWVTPLAYLLPAMADPPLPPPPPPLSPVWGEHFSVSRRQRGDTAVSVSPSLELLMFVRRTRWDQTLAICSTGRGADDKKCKRKKGRSQQRTDGKLEEGDRKKLIDVRGAPVVQNQGKLEEFDFSVCHWSIELLCAAYQRQQQNCAFDKLMDFADFVRLSTSIMCVSYERIVTDWNYNLFCS